MSGKTETLIKAKDIGATELNDVEMVFRPKSPQTGIKPDIHTIANEKKPKLPNIGILASELDTAQPTQPLLEPDRSKPTPPIAVCIFIQFYGTCFYRYDLRILPGPEIDDLDDEKPLDATPYPGIDDGLLDTSEKPDIYINGVATTPLDEDRHSTREDGVGTDDGNWWTEPDEVDGPYGVANGFGPRIGLDDRPVSPMMPGVGIYDDIWSIPDVNTYQQKKNLAQGMMDLALLSANANQLRYVLESSKTHPYYYPSLVFISLSILLQIAVGVGLIMNSRYNVKDDKDICKADKINNMTVLGIFLITIVNVFITSFSVASPDIIAT